MIDSITAYQLEPEGGSSLKLLQVPHRAQCQLASNNPAILCQPAGNRLLISGVCDALDGLFACSTWGLSALEQDCWPPEAHFHVPSISLLRLLISAMLCSLVPRGSVGISL